LFSSFMILGWLYWLTIFKIDYVVTSNVFWTGHFTLFSV